MGLEKGFTKRSRLALGSWSGTMECHPSITNAGWDSFGPYVRFRMSG